MASRLAQALREEQRERVRVLDPDGLLEHVRALWQESLQAYAAAHGVSLREARRRIERHRQRGRAPSACARALVEG
jgi:endonuclease V-like protein UPF0215 family